MLYLLFGRWFKQKQQSLQYFSHYKIIIQLYTYLTSHAVSIGSNDSPFGTFRVMKNHCNDIHLYTSLTVLVLSRNSNNGKQIKQSCYEKSI